MPPTKLPPLTHKPGIFEILQGEPEIKEMHQDIIKRERKKNPQPLKKKRKKPPKSSLDHEVMERASDIRFRRWICKLIGGFTSLIFIAVCSFFAPELRAMIFCLPSGNYAVRSRGPFV